MVSVLYSTMYHMQKDNHVLRQRMVRETGSKTLPPPEVCVHQYQYVLLVPPFLHSLNLTISVTQIHISEVDDEPTREE